MRVAAVVLLLSTLAASAHAATVSGTATYRERVAMPAGARFEATLEEIMRPGANTEVIGRSVIAHPGNPPIHFSIPVPPGKFNRTNSYTVRAGVYVKGKLWFVSDPVPVLTHQHKSQVVLVMRMIKRPTPAPRPPRHTAQLEDTEWTLTRVGSREVVTGLRQRVPYLVFGSNGHRVTGNGGCNRLSGTYRVERDRLTLGPIISTKMACIDMATEHAFLNALRQVRIWKVLRTHLELFDASGNLLARFEAREKR